MRGSRKFCQWGPVLTIFLVYEGRGNPNTTISGPSSTRQRNAIADDGPTLKAGLVALGFFRGFGPVFLRKPYIFCDFSWGGGSGSLSPSGPHMNNTPFRQVHHGNIGTAISKGSDEQCTSTHSRRSLHFSNTQS